MTSWYGHCHSCFTEYNFARTRFSRVWWKKRTLLSTALNRVLKRTCISKGTVRLAAAESCKTKHCAIGAITTLFLYNTEEKTESGIVRKIWFFAINSGRGNTGICLKHLACVQIPLPSIFVFLRGGGFATLANNNLLISFIIRRSLVLNRLLSEEVWYPCVRNRLAWVKNHYKCKCFWSEIKSTMCMNLRWLGLNTEHLAYVVSQ